MPSSMALLIEKIPENSRGLALGIRLTGVRLGFTIGPLLGSLIWSYDPSSAFLLSSLISISVIPLILLIKDNPSKWFSIFESIVNLIIIIISKDILLIVF